MLAFFLTHWWQYYFIPAHEVWWKGAVWGNVFAVLPMAILGGAAFCYHHAVLKGLHKTHDEHLRAIILALDPEAATDSQLDRIVDLVDDTTPGGAGTLREKLDRLEKK